MSGAPDSATRAASSGAFLLRRFRSRAATASPQCPCRVDPHRRHAGCVSHSRCPIDRRRASVLREQEACRLIQPSSESAAILPIIGPYAMINRAVGASFCSSVSFSGARIFFQLMTGRFAASALLHRRKGNSCRAPAAVRCVISQRFQVSLCEKCLSVEPRRGVRRKRFASRPTLTLARS